MAKMAGAYGRSFMSGSRRTDKACQPCDAPEHPVDQIQEWQDNEHDHGGSYEGQLRNVSHGFVAIGTRPAFHSREPRIIAAVSYRNYRSSAHSRHATNIHSIESVYGFAAVWRCEFEINHLEGLRDVLSSAVLARPDLVDCADPAHSCVDGSGTVRRQWRIVRNAPIKHGNEHRDGCEQRESVAL